MKIKISYNNFKTGGTGFSDVIWSIKEIYDKEKIRSELLDISEHFNQAVKTIFKKNGLYDKYLYIYILKKINDNSSVYFQYEIGRAHV